VLRRLFSYGTLQFAAVMAALVRRSPRRRPAVLPRHRVGLLAGRPWPGIAPAPAEATAGILYENLTLAELRRLDRYEGSDYRRATVRVQTLAGRCRSWVYLPRRPLTWGGGAAPSCPAHPADWRVLGLRPPGRPARASKTRSC
jgi:gamma-glutamylcyclotransferase (GGCT)/AIG2-like uncharacterized protein YtfP